MNNMVKEKPKIRAVQERTKDTKAKILNAALLEFARSGFEGVSTRTIANKAAVNHTLISHHFGSKDELWKATAEWFSNAYKNEFLNPSNTLDKVDSIDFIRLHIKEFIYFSAKYPDFHRFMVQANQGCEKRLNWFVDNFIRSGSNSELAILQQAQQLGLFPQGDSLHMRFLFIGAATSIFTFAPEFTRLSGKDPFSNDLLQQHIDYVMSLFRVDKQANEK